MSASCLVSMVRASSRFIDGSTLTLTHTHTGSLPILLDHLLDSYRESSVYRKELFIIISQVLLGAGGGGCVEGKKRVSCGEGRDGGRGGLAGCDKGEEGCIIAFTSLVVPQLCWRKGNASLLAPTRPWYEAKYSHISPPPPPPPPHTHTHTATTCCAGKGALLTSGEGTGGTGCPWQLAGEQRE